MLLAITCMGAVNDGRSAVASDDSGLLVIGGLSMNTLLATNMNVGLAAELHTANPGSGKTVIQAVGQTETTVTNSVKLLETWRASAQLKNDDAEYIDNILKALRLVSNQAAALRKWVENEDRNALTEYMDQRAQVASLIKKMLE